MERKEIKRVLSMGLCLLLLLTLSGCKGQQGAGTGLPGQGATPGQTITPPGGGPGAAAPVPFTGSFTIAPVGPTQVLKGTTLQFTTDPAGLAVTWSVVGGNDNGTITTQGLYSPPNKLPLNTHITVHAEIEGVSQEGTVDLRVGDVVKFGDSVQVNTTKVYLSAVEEEKIYPGASDRLAVREGSLRIGAVWNLPISLNPKATFSQSLDLGPFSPEDILTDGLAGYQQALSLDINNQKNPGILLRAAPDWNTNAAFQYLGSSDQGQSFAPPKNIPVSVPANYARQGDLKFDGQDNIHVALRENFPTFNPTSQVTYTKSSDAGQNWVTPVILHAPVVNEDQCSPYLATSPDGNKIFICYTQGPNCFYDNTVLGSIWLATSQNGGQSFTTKQVKTGDSNRSCRVALGPQGEVYVSYTSYNNNFYDVFLTKSSDGGVNFSNPLPVNAPGEGSQYGIAMMDVDVLGRVDLIWDVYTQPMGTGQTGSGLTHARSLDGSSINSYNKMFASYPNQQSTWYLRGLDHDSAGRIYLSFGSNKKNPWDSDFDIFYVEGE